MAPVLEPQALRPGFQFSHRSLKDFIDCPRRFELKYIQQRAWPAPISDPALEAERRMRAGSAFHRMVQQHLAGISPARIEKALLEPYQPGENEGLITWWQRYLQANPAGQVGRRLVEYPLVASLAGWKLAARLDVLILKREDHGTRALIIDWKTSKPPRRDLLAGSLQTRVYRCLTARCTAALNGGKPVAAQDIEMEYWFTTTGSSMRIGYDAAMYQDDVEVLSGLIADAAAIPAGGYDQKPETKRCEICVYRSLCGIDVQAGSLDDDFDLPDDTGLSLDSVEEIAF